MKSDKTHPEDCSTWKVPWTPLAGLVMLLVFLIVQILLAVVEIPGISDNDWMGVQMALGSTALFVLIWAFVRLRTDSVRRTLGVLKMRFPGWKEFFIGPLKPLLIGLPVLVAWMILQGMVLHYFDIQPPAQPIARWFQKQAMEGLTLRVIFLISLAVVAAPVTEELLFRGLIYLPMRQLYGPLRASLAVSLIFAGVHGYAAGIGHLFILAMILSWLLENTETMIWPILAHSLHNGLMILVMFLVGQSL